MAINFVSRGTENYVEISNPVNKFSNQINMLQSCNISGMLRPVDYNIDGEDYLRYPVSGMYIMERYFLKQKPNGVILKRFISQLVNCILELEKYMLVSDDLVIEMNYIFVDEKQEEFRFIYIPGYGVNAKEQLRKVLEKLMVNFDHKDYGGVEYLYRIYHEIIEDNFVITNLCSAVCKESKNNFSDNNLFRKEGERKLSDDNLFRKEGEGKLSDDNLFRKEGEKKISNNNQLRKEGEKKILDYNLFWKESSVLKSDNVLEEPYYIKSENNIKKNLKTVDRKKRKSIIKYVLVGINMLFIIALFTLFVVRGQDKRFAYGIIFLMIILIIQIVGVSLEEDEDEDVAMTEYIMENNKRQEENKTTLKQNKSISEQERTMFNQNKSMSEQERTMFKQNKSISEQERTTLKRNKSMSEGNRTILDEYNSIDNSKNFDVKEQIKVLDTGSRVKSLMPLSNGGLSKIDLTNRQGEITFGREEGEVDYGLKTTQISRLHASLICKEGRYYLRDNSSTNGTYVNNKRLSGNELINLKSGDLIRFANEEFLVI